MTKNTLLFCNALQKDKVSWLQEQTGLNVEIIPLITFQNIPTEEWMSTYDPEFKTWIFTSKRAAKAIIKAYSNLPEPDAIYCVGPTTASYFDGFPIPVYMPLEYNSKALAELILQDNVRHSVHFKGNLSGDELVDTLINNGVIAEGIEVYRTLSNPQKVATENTKGIVFMSPSAIQAFTEKNNIEVEIPVFCIGSTTGNYAHEQGFKNVQIPDNYSLESLVQMINSYFNE